MDIEVMGSEGLPGGSGRARNRMLRAADHGPQEHVPVAGAGRPL
jgi:hypothetical protein